MAELVPPWLCGQGAGAQLRMRHMRARCPAAQDAAPVLVGFSERMFHGTEGTLKEEKEGQPSEVCH